MSNRTFLKLIQTKIVVPVTLDLCSKHVTFDVQSISAQCFRGVSFSRKLAKLAGVTLAIARFLSTGCKS